ncbi:DUF896 domain-containing protein [Lacticaseibacillus hulanensis]|uniref:DUF896 domain-containing protein n=1 Tax=Lacticaseibacillus hulanensis TaxID=2493111 RepID=UPI000FD95025|nr:DUF896 domain-containing protein [Lacticaseibacillus hulanensis]
MASQPQERIDRINELARKKKTEGLTAAELAEQAELRKAYLADFRAGFKQQVETTQFFDKQGNEITPEKLVHLQKKRGWRDK